MNFTLHQSNISPPVFHKRSAQGGTILRARAVAPWCTALCMLLGCSALFAAEPRFSAVPGIDIPITNTTTVGVTGVTNAQPGGTNALSQNATNSISAESTNAMAALDDKYRLAIGDRLSFRIVEDQEDPRALFVTDSGELELPYIGRYPAVGRTCKELAGAIKAELEKEYYYQATVIIAVDVMARSRGKVYLVGPVRAPGPQDIPSDEVLTLSKAVLRAGGFTDYADRRNVRVTRTDANGGQEQTFTVNVEDVLEKGKIESDLPLQPGDLIFVPERLIRF